MEALINGLLSIAIALTPFLVVIALLRLAESVSVRRDARNARQIALTDAIHRELGAVAAPMVSRRPGGGWLVSMAVPLDRPRTTAAIVRITERIAAKHLAAEHMLVESPLHLERPRIHLAPSRHVRAYRTTTRAGPHPILQGRNDLLFGRRGGCRH